MFMDRSMKLGQQPTLSNPAMNPDRAPMARKMAQFGKPQDSARPGSNNTQQSLLPPPVPGNLNSQTVQQMAVRNSNQPLTVQSIGNRPPIGHKLHLGTNTGRMVGFK